MNPHDITVKSSIVLLTRINNTVSEKYHVRRHGKYLYDIK